MNDPQNPIEQVFGRKNEEKNPYVGVAGTVGVFACGVAGIFMVFAGPGGVWAAALAISALAVMGIFMAYFLSKRN